MIQSSLFFRDDFQLKENNFALPELSIELDSKRSLTICNLFVTHKLSISNIERVMDQDRASIVLALIEHGIVHDRRQIAGQRPAGLERRRQQGRVKV